MKGRLNATQIFLVYALPALSDCMKNDEEREVVRRKLEHALQQGTEIPDKDLTDYFPKAIERRNNYAKMMNPEILNDRRAMNILYWREGGHNSYVDKLDKSCSVQVGLIVKEIKIKNERRYAFCISENGFEPFLIPDYHRDLEVDDVVSVHKRCIAEIFDGKNTRPGQ